jgi:uncharacterized protein (DUF1501 family)
MPLPARNRAHPSRRDLLRIGGLSLGGLALADLLATRSLAAPSTPSPLRDKSVIFLFMQGGPSQFETFDPKMSAPLGVRSATGEIRTAIPGVTFGSTFEKLARLNDKFSVVRSFYTGDGNHDIKTVVGVDTLKANVGSLYSRIAGPIRSDNALPNNVALFPQAVLADAGPPVTQFGDLLSTGDLGPAHRPFVLGGDQGLAKDLKLGITPDRLADRLGLLRSLDGWKRQIDATADAGGIDAFQQPAVDVLRRGITESCDLTKEDARTVARYDTTNMVPRASISKRWNNHKMYGDHAGSIGKLLLLARRLCERGCGFVTISTSFVWDMHADDNNATMTEGMGYVGRPFDHAVSAFIQDVEARGLSEEILLVCCGEMGRTPHINKTGGRDHWGKLAPLMLYGGGLKMGRVIGQSSKDGGEPAADPVSMADLLATIMHVLVDVGEVRLNTGLPRNLLTAITKGEAIKGLV